MRDEHTLPRLRHGPYGHAVGFGVRESAPGYLDCTEWEVFETIEEAQARADEIDAEYEA